MKRHAKLIRSRARDSRSEKGGLQRRADSSQAVRWAAKTLLAQGDGWLLGHSSDPAKGWVLPFYMAISRDRWPLESRPVGATPEVMVVGKDVPAVLCRQATGPWCSADPGRAYEESLPWVTATVSWVRN